jgi:hypothetical protein
VRQPQPPSSEGPPLLLDDDVVPPPPPLLLDDDVVPPPLPPLDDELLEDVLPEELLLEVDDAPPVPMLPPLPPVPASGAAVQVPCWQLPNEHGVPSAFAGLSQAPVAWSMHVPASWHSSLAAQVTPTQ